MREVKARVNDFILKMLNRVIGAGSGLKILTGIFFFWSCELFVNVLFCCFALKGKKSEEVPKPFKCSALEDIWPPAQPRTERIPSPKPWGDSAAVRSHLESASLKIDRPNAGVDGEALPLSGDPPPRNTARVERSTAGKALPGGTKPLRLHWRGNKSPPTRKRNLSSFFAEGAKLQPRNAKHTRPCR